MCIEDYFSKLLVLDTKDTEVNNLDMASFLMNLIV